MQSKPELEVIVPEWNAPENIRAFFTLRSGGISETISIRFAAIAGS